MRPFKRPRTKTVKWLGTVLSAAVLVIWISSGWWYARVVVRPRYAFSVTYGQLWISTDGDYSQFDTLEVYIPRDRAFHFSWSFTSGRFPNPLTQRTMRFMAIPLWTFVLLAAVPTALFWWRDWHRWRPGLCTRCGYDLRGAEHSVCPECGADPGSAANVSS